MQFDAAIVPYRGPAIKQSYVYVQKNLKARLQAIFDDSFKAQFRDYDHFRQYGMGDIVVLVGTSTAGKTSIIKALKQFEKDRFEDGIDLRFMAMDLKNIKKYCSNEVEILAKVFKNPLCVPLAVFCNERVWKADISPQEKGEAEEAIEKIKKRYSSFSPQENEDVEASFQNVELEMYDEAFEYSRRGGNIIFDVLNIDHLAEHILRRNFKGPLRATLVYCPFHTLSARMEKRNQEALENGEISNQRIGVFPLVQFSEIYSKKAKGEKPFERLTRNQVLKTFDANFQKGVEQARLNGRTPPSYEKNLNYFLKNLGFEDGIDVVEIGPKNPHFYHLVLNSNIHSPLESAQIIHDGTY